MLPREIGGQAFVTSSQMLGSLLICAGAEICREESREDSVWPTILRLLPNSLKGELFMSNGQPNFLTKDIIAESVRALNLRNAMDIEGTQQWFLTIKLQFGFTLRGAKKRLAEWLVNLGRPHAVQHLNGESEFPDLVSESFQSLWISLAQYRENLIDEAMAREVLWRSPWVKNHWVDDLLKEAKAKITVLGTGESYVQPVNMDVAVEQCCPFVKTWLRWPLGSPPRIVFRLDRTAIEEQIASKDIRELDFYIDGSKICRWCRQPNGSWSGEDDIYAEPDKNYGQKQPNLSPRAFVIQTRTGDSLFEWDFSDSGLLNNIVVFDLKTEEILEAGFEQLLPDRPYAIVCERDCQIEGNSPVETFERSGLAKKAVRLRPPLNEDLRIAYGDFVLWQPLRSQDEQQQRFETSLRTPGTDNLSLNDRSYLLLEGLPEDAESVKLLIHKRVHEMQKFNESWVTPKQVTLSPELAARQHRVRVRFQSEGRTFSQVPRLELNLLGAAMLRHDRNEKGIKLKLEVLKTGDDVNLSEGTASLWIWTPGGDGKARVFEESYQAGRLRYGKIRLRDLAGHGGQLRISGDARTHPMGIRCIDTGCVGGFVPTMLGSDAKLYLLLDKSVADLGNDGYSLFEWTIGKRGQAKFSPLPTSCVQDSSTDRIWKLRYRSNPLALVLTWKGAWLGSWWNLPRINDYIENRLEISVRDFAVLKWLRTPVLHPELVSAVKKAALRHPGSFLKAWRKDEGLPDGARMHGNIPGTDSVIRYFLWNDFPSGHATDAMTLAGGLPKMYEGTRWANLLSALSDISPVLLWKGMKQYLGQYREHPNPKLLEFLKHLVHVQVGLPSASGSSGRLLDYRLGRLKEQVTRATGIAGQRLDEILYARFESMKKKVWGPTDEHAGDFLSMAETNAGRRYLSAQMIVYWLGLAEE